MVNQSKSNDSGANMGVDNVEMELAHTKLELVHQKEMNKSQREQIETLTVANSRLTDHVNFVNREMWHQQRLAQSGHQDTVQTLVAENQRLSAASEKQRSDYEDCRARYVLLQSLITEKKVDINVPALAHMVETCHRANHSGPPSYFGDKLKTLPSPLLPPPPPSPLEGPVTYRAPNLGPHTPVPLDPSSMPSVPTEFPGGSHDHRMPDAHQLGTLRDYNGAVNRSAAHQQRGSAGTELGQLMRKCH